MTNLPMIASGSGGGGLVLGTSSSGCLKMTVVASTESGLRAKIKKFSINLKMIHNRLEAFFVGQGRLSIMNE